jgi:hypothetical protein
MSHSSAVRLAWSVHNETWCLQSVGCIWRNDSEGYAEPTVTIGLPQWSHSYFLQKLSSVKCWLLQPIGFDSPRNFRSCIDVDVHTGSGAYPAFCSMCTGGKAFCTELHVKNEWTITSIPLWRREVYLYLCFNGSVDGRVTYIMRSLTGRWFPKYYERDQMKWN